MKTTVSRSKLISTILLGVALTAGCSSFKSPSSEYVNPGDLCVDVSDLPDPNEPAKRKDETAIRNIANQYGTASRQESPERLLLQAESYFEQGRYHDSARLYKKYLNTPAASSATTDQLALIHYRIGFVADKKTFYTEARDEFAKALQLAPTNLDYLYAHAKACYDAADYATADAQFAALLARAPSHRDALYYYGLTLLEGANRAQAIAPLTSSVGALEARALLADKYYALGDLPNAAAVENETVQLAAQLGKPIPELPHKAKILASAQNNALYAQNVAVNIPAQNDAQAPGVPANPQTSQPTPALVAQAPAQINPIPAGTPNPQPAAQPANDAAQGELAKPRFAQIGPASVQTQPTPAPANPQASQPAPSRSTPAPAQPSAAPATPTPSLSNVEQPRPQAANVAPQSAPATQDLGAFPTFESIAPVIPGETPASAPRQDAPLSVPQTPEQPQPAADVNVPLPPIEPFPDLDDWDDSAFATSGGTDAPQIAPQAVPQQVAPQQAAPRQAIPQQPASTPNLGVPQQPSSYQYAPISPRYAAKGKRRGVISTSYVAPKLVPNAARRPDVDDANEEEEDSENNGVFALVARGEIADSDAPAPLARAEAPTFRVDNPVSDALALVPKANKGKIRSTASFGPSNPGFFAVSSAAQDPGRRLPHFKPGSINDDENVEQNVPDEVAARIVASQTRAPRFVAEAQVMPPAADRLDQYADELDEIDEAAPQRFAIRRLSSDEAFQIFDRLETLASMEDEYLAAPDDEFAFATSGAPYADAAQPAPSRAPAAGFGDYAAPEYVAFNVPDAPASQPVAPQPVAQPFVSQPVAPNAPTPRAIVPQAQPIPQTATSLPVQPAAPVAQSARSTMTSEEKLQAARNAGAQIMELTPEQYRAAVSKGLGGN